jgi:hypothetical protein
MAQNYTYNKTEILRAAKSGNPIRYRSLYIYPLTVNDYELLWGCESALTIRMSTLPVTYAMKSYPEALFYIAMIGENVEVNGEIVARPSDWVRFMSLLCASCKIPLDAMKACIVFNVDNQDKTRLRSVSIRQIAENEESVELLDLNDLSTIRRIIAEMNGRKLPDESENAELAQAEIDMRSSGTTSLDFNLDSLLASVARDQRVRIKDLYEWTIYEFELIRSAIDRERKFTVFGIGENSGMIKFPKGNPYPSIFFDKPAGISGVIDASEFTNRISGAVQATDKLPDNLPIMTR